MQFVPVAGEIEPVHQVFDIEGGEAQGHEVGFPLSLSNWVQSPAGPSPVQEPDPAAEHSIFGNFWTRFAFKNSLTHIPARQATSARMAAQEASKPRIW
jgi:hypothetical protein